MAAGEKRGGVKSFIRKGSWRNRGILREGGGGLERKRAQGRKPRKKGRDPVMQSTGGRRFGLPHSPLLISRVFSSMVAKKKIGK